MSVITKAFEEWLIGKMDSDEPARPDKILFALIPDQDETAPIDRDEAMPTAEQIQYTAEITQYGAINKNALVYSVVLDTRIGDWEYNWVGLIDSSTNTVLMIVHLATQQKIKTQNGQQGNSLTRNLMIEFVGAADAAQITVTPETWQIDFSARLGGIDERQRIENTDIYGDGAFFDDAFLVANDDGIFSIKPGAGYVKGLRVQLTDAVNLDITGATMVWADACFDGTVTGAWAVQTEIIVASQLVDYVENDRRHYVCAVASIDDAGNVTDLRPFGSVAEQEASDALALHEKSRNHPAATLTEKGLVSLSSVTDSTSETEAATPKAVKDAAAAARADSYPLTAGQLNGEAYSHWVNNWRLISGNRGQFWRFDGETLYLMFTKDGDPLGGWNDLRPLAVNYSSGDLSTDHNLYAAQSLKSGQQVVAGSSVYAGNGSSQMAPDGNIYGEIWGGWLSSYIAANMGSGRTVTGSNSAYYTHGNGAVFMQSVGSIGVGANSTVIVTLPTAFPNGMISVTGGYYGSGGHDNASYYYLVPVGNNQVSIQTVNCSGIFYLIVTGY